MNNNIIKTPDKIGSAGNEQAYKSRNGFLSQSPKRAALKSYWRVKKPKKKQSPGKDYMNSTFSSVNVDHVPDRDQFRITAGNMLNLNTIYNNPLKNDKARNIIMSEERETIYSKHFRKLEELWYNNMLENENNQELEDNDNNTKEYLVNIPQNNCNQNKGGLNYITLSI